ncbi:MAG: HipA N-terminal domain-containing protein [Candidatus Omnitrophica bacterium]|nr:HipA N-terminal domain-containing protein [Candidatus Omnitrophota bacterium]
MAETRKGQVFFNDDLAGDIKETSEGYIFEYNEEFLKENIGISVSLPPRREPYVSKELFSFFRGLLPEGWYLGIVCAAQKVDRNDLFGLLLATTSEDTIGAVTVRKVSEKKDG